MKFTRLLLRMTLLTALFLWACGPSEPGAQKVGPNPSATAPSDEKRVEAVGVVPKPISYSVSAIGSLKSPEDVTISSKKSGFIDKILVKEGDRVKKGQVLVQLDDMDARLQVELSEAKTKEAEVSLETDRSTLTRYQKLLESRVIPQQTYDDLNLKVKLDEARLTMARTELSMARKNLSDHRILSPIDGIVQLKIAALGEHVNVAPKDEILKLVQMDPLEIEFYVPESEAGPIHMGSKIQFSLKAFPEERFFATIRFISPAADPATRNVKMKAMVPNPDYRLKPGFFAEVSIQTGGNPAALIIPESSVFSHEGKFFVYTVESGIAKRKEVTTGVRFDGKVEILQGLKKQEHVITSGHEQLSDGIRVVTITK
jgi:membrane fusion protein (multidrug efflux system)